jgi:hypothetical protein
MAFPNQQLFLDRFIAYNKNRYKDDPEIVEALNALQLGAVTFLNPRKETVDGVTQHLTDLNVPGVLTAVNQRFIPADYPLHGVAQLVSENPLVMADLQLEMEAGVYWLRTDEDGSKVGALLVAHGEKTEANVLSLIKGKCLFDLQDSEITVNDDVTQVAIDSPTITGLLAVVESLGDITEAVYNGDFAFDGTLTY